MLTISLHEFKDYDQPALLQYLEVHNETAYELLLPKEKIPTTNDHFSVFWEYYSAAWTGQLLFQISKAFGYYTPAVNTRQPFLFHFQTSDKEALSNIIRSVLDGYYTDHEPMLKFHEEASQFYDSAFEGKTEAACWGLLDLANRYLK